MTVIQYTASESDKILARGQPMIPGSERLTIIRETGHKAAEKSNSSPQIRTPKGSSRITHPMQEDRAPHYPLLLLFSLHHPSALVLRASGAGVVVSSEASLIVASTG